MTGRQVAQRRGGFRLPQGGLIDRGRPLEFTFDSRPLSGYQGDSLASALMANGVRVVARSMKYHRPRGIFAAGLEEPNAMLAVRDGFGYDPAVRAGQVQLAQGMEVRSLTGWPALGFDLGAVAQAAGGLLKAGFYYKTFMWPTWWLYEPFIRRSTGFGRPDPTAPRRACDQRHASCDVLIVGGGVAGLAAAAGLLESGLRVVIADDRPRLGGALLWEPARIDGKTGADWAVACQGKLEAAENVQVLAATLVTGAYEGNFFTLLQTLPGSDGEGAKGGVKAECLWKVQARHVVLATGAVERPLVFAGNDRPGVMLASALRRYLGEFGVAPGREIAVFTNNDGGYRTALAASQAGLGVAAVVDSRPVAGSGAAESVEAAGIACIRSAEVVATSGYKGLRSVTVAPLGGGPARRLNCEVLAVSGGSTPLIHLAAHRGARPVYDDRAAAFVCPQLPEGWLVAGHANGPCGLAEALEQGLAAAQVLRNKNNVPRAALARPAATGPEAEPAAPFWRATTGRASTMWVDLQNDVTVADIELAAREGYQAVEHLKRYTTLGMGTDQGRTSNVNGLAVLAELTGRGLDEVGTTTFRPPYAGVRMATIAHVRHGDLYRPRRLMPAHDSHVAAGAVFEDFGWQRPDWYRCNGETREAAVGAEMAAVRGAVGVFDASPLGKIEVSGPDAAAFLDRFYVTNVMTLKPGALRYSVMLREDGIIFDDGVLACLGTGFYLASPTSGQADAVARWIERWRQTEWPAMKVAVAPVTANWASLALAGPRARDLLKTLNPSFDVSAETFRQMQIREGRLDGVPARIARVSFTGELQYEVSVPARYGRDLLEGFLAAGAALGVRRVGMEAWLRLRLEKGYIHVGADTNGRTTPDDIGMAALVRNKQADFIGKRSLNLPYGRNPVREQLVGVKALRGRLEVGGRVLAAGHSLPPCPSEGYVTSACDSPAAGGSIGLALIERGFARLGEAVRIYCGGRLVEAEICPAAFYDPEGGRLKL